MRWLLITLAASDGDSHVETIAQLAELFMNEEDVAAIMAASICRAPSNQSASASPETTAQAPSAPAQPPSIRSSSGVRAEPSAPPPCNAAV